MRNSSLPRGLWLATALSVLLAPHAFTQGRTDYMNVESPQVSPITSTVVNGRRILVVCNTPDNSVELWDVGSSSQVATPQFIERLWVGLEPVSVLVDDGQFWTANFLGDSVTTGRIEWVNGAVRAVLTKTANVGDEPMDIAFYRTSNGTRTIFVTLQTMSELAWLHADTLAVHSPGVPHAQLVQSSGAPPLGLKEPRAVRVHDDRVFALGLKGGVTGSCHDLDIVSSPIPSIPQTDNLGFDQWIQGLGSTNLNMRFASNGDLYVVGGEAQNFSTNDKIEVRSQPTGFVNNTVYRITGAGTATPVAYRRDLNLEVSGQIVEPPYGALGKPAAQPTDIALYEEGGVVKKIFVAAFGSDRIVVLKPPSGHPATSPDIAGWTRSSFDLPSTSPAGVSVGRGPRSMTLVQAAIGQRLYVACRLDNSVAVVNARSERLLSAESFALSEDPTPLHVRQGREFLYSANLSGTGFVSCASCHVDGRTDALSWRLGVPNPIPNDPTEPPPTVTFMQSLGGTGSFDVGPEGLPSDPGFQLLMWAAQTFDPDGVDDKREMVTQSLQGLLNFEVPRNIKAWFSNAPYHWRGDKPSIREFNEAFVTLLLGNNVGTQEDARGLTEEQMDVFEEFVHSITYPPNPKQPKTRTFSPGNTGGARGLELFHENPTLLGQRSCVQCHALPSGSNNRVTVFVGEVETPGFVSEPTRQPIESAALRGLFQKEPLLEADGQVPTNPGVTPRVGHFGLNHTGLQVITSSGCQVPESDPNHNVFTSINRFVDLFFVFNKQGANAKAVKQFVHEFDWGVAPIVGDLAFLDTGVLGDPVALQNQLARVALMLQQADLANAGVVAWLSRPDHPNAGDRYKGYRWHPPAQTWIEEPSHVLLPPAALLGFVAGATDSLVFLSVPLGNERRIANPAGGSSAPVIAAVQPTSIELGPMRTNTAYASVPSFVDNWYPPWVTVPSNAPVVTKRFQFDAPLTEFGYTVDDVFTKTLRLFQWGLIDGANAANYGVPYPRHEAPRRLVVSGDNILTGAVLLLSVPGPGVNQGVTPLQAAQNSQVSIPMTVFELPLHPTTRVDPNSGQPEWETAAELAPIKAYELMLGGEDAPGVSQTRLGLIIAEYTNTPDPQLVEPTQLYPTPPLPYDPDQWNWHKVEVRNPAPPGTPPGQVTSTAIWRQLKMQ